MTKAHKDIINKAAMVAYEAVMELASSHPSLMRQEAEELAKYVSLKVQNLAIDEPTSTPNRKKLQKTKGK